MSGRLIRFLARVAEGCVPHLRFEGQSLAGAWGEYAGSQSCEEGVCEAGTGPARGVQRAEQPSRGTRPCSRPAFFHFTVDGFMCTEECS